MAWLNDGKKIESLVSGGKGAICGERQPVAQKEVGETKVVGLPEN